MLSKSKLKLIVSLQRKKARDEERLFVIEGDKIVREFLGSEMEINTLIAMPEFIGSLSAVQLHSAGEVIPVSYEELKKASGLKAPHNAMAIVKMPERRSPVSVMPDELVVALDFIQDPGNLGTIIRAAVWFGIRNMICSDNCVDTYNPKVIQATMGAILNITVSYTDLKHYLEVASEKNLPVYGTILEGESIYTRKLGRRGIILLGNESKGISEELLPFITEKLTIPKFTTVSRGIESLNAGMAASIVFSEFARR
ncbi:MAG: RNA methyltransferase [Bacteroidales bacterium]|jgi:TrmH family RNA methyltransferase